MKKLTVLLLLSIVISGCMPKRQERAADLSRELVGEWRNIYVKVVMSTFQNTPDAEKIKEADSTNWEQSLQIKPIRTFFKGDSTYHSDYYNLHDSLIFSVSGKWKVNDDTLIMNQERPSALTYRLHTTIKNNVAEFTGILDFDDDGKADDHYFGMQRKQ